MEQQHHGGDRYRNHILYDASVNVNPLGMPEAVIRRLQDTMLYWSRYPDCRCQALCRALEEFHQIKAGQVLCGNGAADLIWRLCARMKFKRGLVLAPTFSEYEAALLAFGSRADRFFLKEENGFQPDMDELCQAAAGHDAVFFCNPNNPTGVLTKRSQLERLARACQEQGAYLIVDECFNGLCDEPEEASMVPLLDSYPNLLILNAFTKTYGMAGLRLGYLMGADLALLEDLSRAGQPWSVSYPAQEAGAAALTARNYIKESRALIRKEKTYLEQELAGMGFSVYPSQSNFLLFSADAERRGEASPAFLYQQMKKRGILIRDCRSFAGLGAGFYRICVGKGPDNQFLMRIMRGEEMHEFISDHSGR